MTLHAATRAGGLDEQGCEALLKYIRRPAVAQERVTRRHDGLVRIGLTKAFSDGTVAVDLDPLSLLSRLCGSGGKSKQSTFRSKGARFVRIGGGVGPHEWAGRGAGWPRGRDGLVVYCVKVSGRIAKLGECISVGEELRGGRKGRPWRTFNCCHRRSR